MTLPAVILVLTDKFCKKNDCFKCSSETGLTLASGVSRKVKDLKLGDKLKNNMIVQGIILDGTITYL